jgi:hypothetical protein
MKLDTIKPLDIDPYIRKAKNKVALVGVELEGAWVTMPSGVTAPEHDGSVYHGKMPPGARYLGEIPTRAVPPAAIGALINHNYPKYCNETCGLHVHMSFDSLWHYQLLMVPEYPATMTEYLKRWAKASGFKDDHYIWPRLNGKSKYCKNLFYPDLQARTVRKGHDMDIPGERYTAIHYCGRLRTIECRTLPMPKKVSLAISGVHEVIHITNACLMLLGKQYPRKKDMVKVSLPNDVTYEETIISLV